MHNINCGLWLLLLIISIATVNSATQNSTVHEGKRVVCQFNSWSMDRRGKARFDIGNIDTSLCTHVIYAYVGSPRNRSRDAVSNNTIYFNVNPEIYSNFTSLKLQNPNIKMLASYGGWVHSSRTLSRISANKKIRSAFIREAISFQIRHNFDGINIDWEPTGKNDKRNFVRLLKEMRREFSNHSLLISVSVSGNYEIMNRSYEVHNMSLNVDFVIIKAYEYPSIGSQDCYSANAPLHDGVTNDGLMPCDHRNNVESSVNFWLEHGAPAHKLVLGIAASGRFTLKTTSGATLPNSNLRLPSHNVKMAYRDICQEIKGGLWSVNFDETQKVPVAESQVYRISYDNERSVSEKCGFVKEKSLGGSMLDSLDTEDFEGSCSSNSYPLLRTLWSCLNLP